MASRDDAISKRGEHVDEDLPSRRSRLWLGESSDNLRNSGSGNSQQDGNYTFYDEYGNLDELAAPSPVERPGKRRTQGDLEERNLGAASDGNQSIQESYENLDEVAAPPPVASPEQERKQGYLEDRHGTADFTRLNQSVPASRDPEEVVGAPTFRRFEQRRESWSPSSEELQAEKLPNSQQSTNVSRLATETYTISYLIFFSILGTLARLGLQALTFYPGAPVQTGLLWANVGGSLIMGFLSEDRKLFQDAWSSPREQSSRDRAKSRLPQRTPSAKQRQAAVKKTLPLYIGLATGFCGSFTSFSSFIRDAFFALSNALHVPIQHPSSAPISQTIPVPRNPGYSFLAVLAVLISTVGLSLMALHFGAHVALFLEPYIPSVPFLFGRKLIDRVVVFLALGSWLGAIFMSIFPPDRPGGPVGNALWTQETWRSQALFALVFAPIGCLLRFYASLFLNGKVKSFPLGTFTVNIFGTVMDAVFTDLQRAPIGGMGCFNAEIDPNSENRWMIFHDDKSKSLDMKIIKDLDEKILCLD
ncbi:hypothetical protein ACLMJK_009528 [Lecanora helva]